MWWSLAAGRCQIVADSLSALALFIIIFLFVNSGMPSTPRVCLMCHRTIHHNVNKKIYQTRDCIKQEVLF